jgi:hypothetical protein
MIMTIVVGSGSKRKVLPLVREKSSRYEVGKAIKNALFPTHALYGKAKRRGEAAIAAWEAKRSAALA